MKLSQALVQKNAWVEWKAGIRLQIVAVDKKELSEWLDYAKVTEFDRKTHQRVTTTDNDKFLKKIASHIIAWEGVTGDVLAQLGTTFNKGTKDQVYECSEENKMVLLRHADDFEVWVIEKMKDIQTFEDVRVETEKKD